MDYGGWTANGPSRPGHSATAGFSVVGRDCGCSLSFMTLPSERPHSVLRRSTDAGIVVVLALLLWPHPCGASTVPVPPVQIEHLTHGRGSGASTTVMYTQDYVFIPGADCSNVDPITLTYAGGDVIRIRIQAPAGKMFRVQAPATSGTEYFACQVYWWCTAGCSGGGFTPYDAGSVTFENLHGVPPTASDILRITANAQVVGAGCEYTVSGAFDFTALVFDIQSQWTFPSAARSFGGVSSNFSPAFVASLNEPIGSANPDTAIMAIVDRAGPVATARTSWGRVKSLYR